MLDFCNTTDGQQEVKSILLPWQVKLCWTCRMTINLLHLGGGTFSLLMFSALGTRPSLLFPWYRVGTLLQKFSALVQEPVPPPWSLLLHTGHDDPVEVKGLDSHCNAWHHLAWVKAQLRNWPSSTLSRTVKPHKEKLPGLKTHKGALLLQSLLVSPLVTPGTSLDQKNSHSQNATRWQSRDNLIDLEGFSSLFWQ